MKGMKLLLMVLSLCPLLLRAGPLPPTEVRGNWSEFADFATWRIREFRGWDVPFDGGSKVFFFGTAAGERFEVMAANPAYWTEQEKKAGKQVFFVLRDKKFYRLEPGSEPETGLIRMIGEARPRLTGRERTDPKLLDELVVRLRDRKAMFKPAP
jgi:hypothetical protein